MKKILAFDQATALTGYASFNVDGYIAQLKNYGLINCTQSSNHTGIENMMKLVCEKISEECPDVVVIEETVLQNNASTLKSLSKLQGSIIYYCYINKIKLEIYYPTHWRKMVGFEQTKGLKRPQLKKMAQDIAKSKYDISVPEDIADAICIGTAYINEYCNKGD